MGATILPDRDTLMNIHLLAVGEKIPQWVQTGYDEFAKRLPGQCALRLLEIPAGRRSKGINTARALQAEGTRILAAIPRNCHVVALDIGGRCWSTEQLAERLENWLAGGHDVAMIIGGADGLAAECLARSDELWSLSALTYPHALVRVIVAEQVYRAWSILRNHPYHRG
jgi:23S rRNA (pseudouridine1915-N3)-methyltransferase